MADCKPQNSFDTGEVDQDTCSCVDTTEAVPLLMSGCFADCIAKASHAVYTSLPKTGKPQPGQEWTLLASVSEVI